MVMFSVRGEEQQPVPASPTYLARPMSHVVGEYIIFYN